MDKRRYERYLSASKREFEALCTRCGECCGALDDPCVNLARGKDGKYYCRDYADRIGPQKTVSGKSFNCVHIREHIAARTLRPNCAYRSVR